MLYSKKSIYKDNRVNINVESMATRISARKGSVSKVTAEQRRGLEKRIMEGLLRERMIKTWLRDKPDGWTLASGLYSPFFINLRLISSVNPQLYRDAATAMGILLDEAGFTANGRRKLLGVAMAGIPLANALTLQKGIPSLYTRKLPEEVKTPEDVKKYLQAHGQKSLVEGEINSGDDLAIIDDLVTKFSSKLLAIAQVREEIANRGLDNVSVENIFVLVDREQGAARIAEENGFVLHAFIPFEKRGIGLIRDSLEPAEYEVIMDYLKDPQKYQAKEMQDKLKSMTRKNK